MVSSGYVLRVDIDLLGNMSGRARMHRLGRLLISFLSLWSRDEQLTSP